MELSYKTLSEEINNSEIPLFVECWASWCLPCKQYDSILEELTSKYAGRCNVFKVNVDRNPQMSTAYEVHGLPLFITFYRGQEISRKVGAQTTESIRFMIEDLLSKTEIDADQGEVSTGFIPENEEAIVEQRLKDLGYL